MKHLPLFALVCAVLLIALALVSVPGCVGPLVETPPAWRRQRATMRQNALGTAKKLEQRHGDTPVEEWPETDRLTYMLARKILGDVVCP